MMNGFYSNGRAVVAGYDEAYSSGLDDAFTEDPGAEAARRHNEMEARWAVLEADAAMELERDPGCNDLDNVALGTAVRPTRWNRGF